MVYMQFICTCSLGLFWFQAVCLFSIHAYCEIEYTELTLQLRLPTVNSWFAHVLRVSVGSRCAFSGSSGIRFGLFGIRFGSLGIRFWPTRYSLWSIRYSFLVHSASSGTFGIRFGSFGICFWPILPSMQESRATCRHNMQHADQACRNFERHVGVTCSMQTMHHGI